MGFFSIFGYRNTKSSDVADLGLRHIQCLLHPLASLFWRSGLGCKDIPDQRLDMVCADGSYDTVVLVEFKVD